jgi:peptidoglycan hydrolase-like protein with peptidoglycan-binding domain
MRRLLLAAGVVAAVLGAAAAGTLWVVHRHSAAGSPTTTEPLATATAQAMSLRATERVNATVTFDEAQPILLRRNGTYTWLPAPATVLREGSVVAAVDGEPVVMMQGAVPAWRAFQLGMPDGDDVRELESALHRLGLAAGVSVDRHFSAATATAVRRWQRSLHLPVTGAVADGAVIFAPDAVRVGQLHVTVGAPVAAIPPYDVTGTAKDVHADLDAARQADIAVGAEVSVAFLDGRRADARVSQLGRVATFAASDGTGPSTPTVPLTVTFTHPSDAGTLDQQPVQIEVTTSVRPHVLAVPVTALVSLNEGGDAVETVDASGAHTLVAVSVGMFAAGFVEITHGLSAGQVVVVAQ